MNNVLPTSLSFQLRWVHTLIAFCFGAVFCVVTASASAVEIQGVRLSQTTESTRVVFDLSGPVEYTTLSLSNPNRFVLDIDGNPAMRANLAALPLANTPINEIRAGVQKNNHLHVVLEFNANVETQHFFLAKRGDASDRLVVDLFSSRAVTAQPVRITDPSLEGRRDIIITVDPGHGGNDPGAMGQKRTKEKDVVLDIARRLTRLINAQPGYRAEMTRTGDELIPLKKRRDIARAMRADFFVSIHADSVKQSSARGASVYASNPNGRLVTSESAQFLAQRENQADLIAGLTDISLKDYQDEVVAGTLLDLIRTETLSTSLEVGEHLLASLSDVARLHRRSVESADFVVLRSPDVPSLLIESGFISNVEEEKRLNSASYRQQLAEKIFAGIQSYFYKKPLPGTYVAWQKNNGGGYSEHVIVRGETLSAIALRYKVSVAEIIAVNSLSDTRIRVGQRLKIPAI